MSGLAAFGVKIRRAAASVGILMVAALVAWVTTIVLLAVLGIFAGDYGPGIGLIAGVFTMPFWFCGLALMGGPIWLVLHRAGRTDRRTAMVTAAGVAAVATPLLVWAMFTGGTFALIPEAVLGLLLTAALASPGGAVAGFIVWALAYEGRRVK